VRAKRLTFILAFVALLGTAFAIAAIRAARQPSYRGRTVRQWVTQYATSPYMGEKDEAIEALQAMPDAVSRYLIPQSLAYANSGFWRAWHGVAKRLPTALSRWPFPYDPDRADEVLWQLRPSAAAVLPLLKDSLSRTNTQYYNYAIWLLGSLGEGGEQAVPYLVQACASTNFYTRILAVQSLQHLGAGARGAEAVLINALQDSRTRLRAIEALGHIGPPAIAAKPLIESRLASTNLQERLSAAAALHRIAPEEGTIRLLAQAAASTNEANEGAVVGSILADLGPAARPIVPALLRILREDDSLWMGNSGAGRAWAILNGLRRIDPTNHEVVRILLDKLPAADKWRSQGGGGMDMDLNIALWLVRFDPGEPTGIRVLSNYVQRRNADDASFGLAIDELRKAGPAAKAAIPALKAAAADPKKEIRKAARWALKAVEGS
jgi:hypothetical protein